MTTEDLRTVAALTGAVLALFIVAGAVISTVTGSWQPLAGSLTGAAVAIPIVAVWLLLVWTFTNLPGKARNRKDHR